MIEINALTKRFGAHNAVEVLDLTVPSGESKNWVRVPRVRSSVTAIYQPNPMWSAAATYRYSGRQWNEINNIDINPDVYGGLSRVKQVDVKFRWIPRKNTEVALGIDNVTDYRAFQSHPFPGRIYFAEVRAGF